MVSLNGSLRFEIWIEIQDREGVGLVVLNMSSEYLEWKFNCKYKFLLMMYNCFVGTGIIDEIMINIF